MKERLKRAAKRTMKDETEMVTVSNPFHRDLLCRGLWKQFLIQKRTDMDFKCANQSMRAHKMIVEIFLPPSKTFPDSVDMDWPQEESGVVGNVLEFMYRGSSRVGQERLAELAQVARELNFRLLVDACESAGIERAGGSGDPVGPTLGGETGSDPDFSLVGPEVAEVAPLGTLGRPERSSGKSVGRLRSDRDCQTGSERSCQTGSNPDYRAEPEVERDDVVSSRTRKRGRPSGSGAVKAMESPSEQPRRSSASLRRHLKYERMKERLRREREALPFLKCAHCQFRTKSEKLHRRHLAAHGSDDSNIVFPCDVCKRTFADLQAMATHRLGHRPRSCPHCSDFKTFEPYKYDRHLRVVHGLTLEKVPRKQPNQCLNQQCRLPFESKKKMLEHLRTVHPDDKHFGCSHCSKAFKNPTILRVHSKTHQLRDKNAVCELCGFRTVYPSHLKKHYQSKHSDERPFPCQTCQRSFKRLSKLKEHERLHVDNTKDHVCHFCGKAFNRADNLKTHLRIHTQERPFKCELCPRSFNSKQSLDIHCRTHSHETDATEYNCHLCPRTYASRQGLVLHLQTHADDKQFRCEYCQRSFNHKRALSAHLKTHEEVERPFKCHVCGCSFMGEASLSMHVRKLHRDESRESLGFACPQCPRRYGVRDSYLRHIRCHAISANGSVKQHVCSVCNRRFSKFGNLKIHLRDAHEMEAEETRTTN